MSELAKKLKGIKMPTKRKGPVWQGPEVDGITQSLLSRFLVCRERFRLLVVHGLKPVDRFSARIEYGNMWHKCEEIHSLSKGKGNGWEQALLSYCMELVKRYRSQQVEIDKRYNVCKTQFPIYLKYWSKHKHTTTRKHLLEEQEFKVPYKLPSGRVVTLRGKWDAVDLVNKNLIYLQENKAKGELDEQLIRDQMQFDMQTMIYLVALQKCLEYAKRGTSLDTEEMLPEDAHWGNLVYPSNAVLAGVRYNCIRRPLSGGKGSIVQHKATSGSKCPKCKGVGKLKISGLDRAEVCPKCGGMKRVNAKPEETAEAFYKRLADIIMEDSFDAKGKPLDDSSYFMRWDCRVSQADVQRFEKRFLIPILEQVWDWWEFMQECDYDPWDYPVPAKGAASTNACLDCAHEPRFIHYQTPFGFYNILAEGGRTDLDEYINNGNELGLQRTNNLFPELT